MCIRDSRKDRAANAIRFYDVDILGTQEVLHNQLEDLKQRLPEYGVIGVGREDGKEKGEYSALWYKKDRFNLLDSGYFWLSETPEVAGSKGWDGAVSYTHLRAHETRHDLVCRLLLEKKKKKYRMPSSA